MFSFHIWISFFHGTSPNSGTKYCLYIKLGSKVKHNERWITQGQSNSAWIMTSIYDIVLDTSNLTKLHCEK